MDRSALPAIDALPSCDAIGKAPAQRAIAVAISSTGTQEKILVRPANMPGMWGYFGHNLRGISAG
jgi:hypothetical protein